MIPTCSLRTKVNGKLEKYSLFENNFRKISISIQLCFPFVLGRFSFLPFRLLCSVCCNIYIYNHLVLFSCNLTLCKHRFLEHEKFLGYFPISSSIKNETQISVACLPFESAEKRSAAYQQEKTICAFVKWIFIS